LLEYDDVANDQRKVVYQQRNELIDADSFQDTVAGVREDVFRSLTHEHVPPNSVDTQWNLPSLEKTLDGEYGIRVDLQKLLREKEEIPAEEIEAAVRRPWTASSARRKPCSAAR
jgi:preprotein translocase subunit SecA